MKIEKNVFLTLSVYVSRVTSFLLLLFSILIFASIVLKNALPASIIKQYSFLSQFSIFEAIRLLFLSFLVAGFGQFTKCINEKKMTKKIVLYRADMIIYLYCCAIVAQSVYIVNKFAAIASPSAELSYIFSPLPSVVVSSFLKIVLWIAFSIVLKKVLNIIEDSFECADETGKES